MQTVILDLSDCRPQQRTLATSDKSNDGKRRQRCDSVTDVSVTKSANSQMSVTTNYADRDRLDYSVSDT